MKKLITVLLLLLFCSLSFAADDQVVCGKSYVYMYNDALYVANFVSNNPELPCVDGHMYLVWPGNYKQYSFTIKRNVFVEITGLGTMVLYDNLYWIDPKGIVFEPLD